MKVIGGVFLLLSLVAMTMRLKPASALRDGNTHPHNTDNQENVKDLDTTSSVTITPEMVTKMYYHRKEQLEKMIERTADAIGRHDSGDAVVSARDYEIRSQRKLDLEKKLRDVKNNLNEDDVAHLMHFTRVMNRAHKNTDAWRRKIKSKVLVADFL